MCLFSNTPIPSIAQEDIICYKRFEIHSLFKKLLLTPFRLEVVDSEEFRYMFKASSNKPISPIYSPNVIGYAIGEGFIHAYIEKPLPPSNIEYCTVLCKIHKGTKYYVSWDRSDLCASEMELIKIIT